MRKLICLIGIITIVVCMLSALAYAQSPLDSLSTLRNFRAMRTSSVDPNLDGNGDSRYIGPGETLTVAELKGPGKIAHIWCTIADDEPFYGKLLVLRMYWDGEKTPSVESPINDFFCEGHGVDMTVNSFPIRVTSDGRGRNCYWPMPFGKSAKITVTNEGKMPVGALYYYVDWQQMDKLPKNEAYFHAQYRQEYPATKGQDYLILDAEGRGQYVGCNLSVRQHTGGWWGEGDDKFFIDGDTKPTLQGTGSEDYFCDGWGIRQLDGLYYGFPITEGYNILSRHTNYRFHIQDPIPFTKSLKMTIEHRGAGLNAEGKGDGYVERLDDFSSVAYWYQIEPHKAFPVLPPAEKRLYDYIRIEGESLLDNAVGKNVDPARQGGGWSGGAQLFATPMSAPASVTVKFSVKNAGKYNMNMTFTIAPDYGKYQTYLDGEAARSAMDLYNPTVSTTTYKFGIRDLTAGEHELKFETKEKNPTSTGYFFGLDYIELIMMK